MTASKRFDHPPREQYGNMGEALTGAPRVYGRVYLGTNGRGIIYGDTASTASSGTATEGDNPGR